MSNYPIPRRATSYPEEMRPQLIMANDEKIFVEELEGNEVVLKEKSLVDTVYELRDQVSVLQKVLHILSVDYTFNLGACDNETKRQPWTESKKASGRGVPPS